MPDTFLLVGPSWIGDMVMAQSLCIHLKQQQPDCSIDILAPAWSLPVIARMPEVRRGIALATEHGETKLAYRYQLGKKLRAKNYSKAIIIPRSFKAALVPFFARIPKRIGFKGEMRYGLINDMRPLDKSVLTQTVQRMVALGVSPNLDLNSGAAKNKPPHIPFPTLQVDTDAQKHSLEKFAIAGDKPLAGLMPGAEYGPAKQWPLEYFAQAADQLTEQGFNVVIFGSDKDRAAGESIAAFAQQPVRNLCGKTSLPEAIDLLAVCKKVITNDSGLMHVAAALGCEIIAIYGSSSPDYTPPLTDKKQIHYLGLDCSPCFDRMCKFKTYDCLHKIRPQRLQ